jgi:hypothetical protein
MIECHMDATSPWIIHSAGVVAPRIYALTVLVARAGVAPHTRQTRARIILRCPSGRLGPQAEAPAATVGGGLVHVQRRPPRPVLGRGGTL